MVILRRVRKERCVTEQRFVYAASRLCHPCRLDGIGSGSSAWRGLELEGACTGDATFLVRVSSRDGLPEEKNSGETDPFFP